MRVLIVADNPLTAEGIRRELRSVPTFEVIGYVNGRADCSPTITNAQPDIVILDEMSDQAVIFERIREARRAVPRAKLVLLTSRMDPGQLGKATAAGIDAAVAKTLQSGGLGALIRQVAAGNVFHAFAPCPEPLLPSASEAGLTGRELEILRLVAAGASNAGIAKQLWVTEQTVKFHLSNTFKKLDVSNRTEASHVAHTRRLLEVQPDHLTERAA